MEREWDKSFTLSFAFVLFLFISELLQLWWASLVATVLISTAYIKSHQINSFPQIENRPMNSELSQYNFTNFTQSTDMHWHVKFWCKSAFAENANGMNECASKWFWRLAGSLSRSLMSSYKVNDYADNLEPSCIWMSCRRQSNTGKQ